MNVVDGACSTYRREERCIEGLVGKPEEKKPVGRSRHRLEYNKKMDLEV